MHGAGLTRNAVRSREKAWCRRLKVRSGRSSLKIRCRQRKASILAVPRPNVSSGIRAGCGRAAGSGHVCSVEPERTDSCTVRVRAYPVQNIRATTERPRTLRPHRSADVRKTVILDDEVRRRGSLGPWDPRCCAQPIGQKEIRQGEPGRVLVLGKQDSSAPPLERHPCFRAWLMTARASAGVG